MIKNDRIIKSLIYGDVVDKLSKIRNINITEARALIAEMSFAEYRKMEEASADIIPPSGNPISPQPSTPSTITPPAIPGQQPTGTPPGTLQQQNNKQVAPNTSQQSNQPTPPPTSLNTLQKLNPQQQQELQRLQQLAGIQEDGSSGASCAGAMGASTPQPMGVVKRRQPADEALKTEYTPRSSPKTIAGDVKPNQASGQLSANLAASGIKTASRKNNGIKK